MSYQFSFLPKQNKIINVASVPFRSPFRYPGGKTWFVPRIRQWLASQPVKPDEFIEPFTGGGIVGLTVAFENLAQRVTLVELDQQIAAVWKTLLYGDGKGLADRIVAFDFSVETVCTELKRTGLSTEDEAFQTILKNRVNRGGILAPGAGKIKHGENGKGLASRWYPETLSKRIHNIVAIRDRFRFIEGDGITVLKENRERPNRVFFIDPPYTAGSKRAGSRLYTHFELDHEALFQVSSQLAGDFLMTYSNDPAVQRLANSYQLTTKEIAMKNTHHAKMTELLIGRDLSWDM
ncbi:DNA adenine methylase [Anaerolineales bacterium HSG24]|nr:DNA adenine methylase [Anaerolineales bacterium HSG24]